MFHATNVNMPNLRENTVGDFTYDVPGSKTRKILSVRLRNNVVDDDRICMSACRAPMLIERSIKS